MAADLGPELISFALSGRPPAEHGAIFLEFHRLFLKKHPLTGDRQLRKYLVLSRRILHAVARAHPSEQQHVRDEIYRRLIAPVGHDLDDNEFGATLDRLRGVMQDLVLHYRLTLDPADIPRPQDEREAAARAASRARRSALAPPDDDEDA